MSNYKKNKVRAFFNLIGTLLAIAALVFALWINAGDRAAQLLLITGVILIGFGRR